MFRFFQLSTFQVSKLSTFSSTCDLENKTSCMSHESIFFMLKWCWRNPEVGKFQLKVLREVFPTSFRTFQLQIVRNKNLQLYLQTEMGLMDFLIAPDKMVLSFNRIACDYLLGVHSHLLGRFPTKRRYFPWNLIYLNIK